MFSSVPSLIYWKVSGKISLNFNLPTVVTKYDSAYLSAIVIEPDWEEETAKSDYSVYLGKQDLGFYFIQPFQDNLMIVNSRCSYNYGDPEQNAIIFDKNDVSLTSNSTPDTG